MVIRTSRTRDGIALVLAALRDDRMAAALLTADMDAQAARDTAIFCAYIAAQQFSTREAAQHAPGHYAAVFEALAMQVAASPDGTITSP